MDSWNFATGFDQFAYLLGSTCSQLRCLLAEHLADQDWDTNRQALLRLDLPSQTKKQLLKIQRCARFRKFLLGRTDVPLRDRDLAFLANHFGYILLVLSTSESEPGFLRDIWVFGDCAGRGDGRGGDFGVDLSALSKPWIILRRVSEQVFDIMISPKGHAQFFLHDLPPEVIGRSRWNPGCHSWRDTIELLCPTKLVSATTRFSINEPEKCQTVNSPWKQAERFRFRPQSTQRIVQPRSAKARRAT
jgi:hypothetical protein